MKIEKVNVYQADLPVNEGAYNFADGKSVSVFDATVVEIITDSGIKGYGEVRGVLGTCITRGGWWGCPWVGGGCVPRWEVGVSLGA